MKQYFWIGILLLAAVVKAQHTSFQFAIGFMLPWFILGLVLSPVWWFVTKNNRKDAWKWFDWLNVGAIIMVIFLVLSAIVKGQLG